MNKFVYYNFMYSNELMEQMIKAMPKGQYPSINKTYIESFFIHVPSLAEQKQIISQIEKLEAEIDSAKNIISNTAERKKAVLDKYLL